MTKGELKLDDVRLAYTDDPYTRKVDVLRAASLDCRKNGTQEQVSRIAKAISSHINKLQTRKQYPHHQVLLALDHIVLEYANTIYEVGAAVETEGEE